MIQESLFTQLPPHQKHSATSVEAANEIYSGINALQRDVLHFLRERGRSGATDEEMQLGLKMNPSTQRPRRIELMDRGIVIDSGDTRPTRSGRKAVVWKIKPESERPLCRQ